MNGPFPGIDPYLEARFYWRDFHVRFLSNLADTLNAVLPANYDARIDERVSMIEERLHEEVRAFRLPDVSVVESAGRVRGESRSATAVVVTDAATETIPLVYVEEEIERFLKVTHRPDQSLVAVIELLSPTNKRDGYVDYLFKRTQILREPVHLVELDFLLSGRRMPLARPLPKGDYFALVARAERRPDCQVHAWSIREPLPRIALPLKPPDPDVGLDLAALFAMTYERGRYTRVLDYTQDLALPLSPENRAWAEGLARAFAASAKGER